MAQRINTIIEFEQKSIGKSGALFGRKTGQDLVLKKIRSMVR
jgi:hypothetical protein